MQTNFITNLDELGRRLYEPVQGEAPALDQGRTFVEWEYKIPSFVVSFITRINRERIVYRVSKRALDISISLVLLTLFSPLFIVVPILIKLSSPGPMFFKHTRLGQHGREFRCVKFRTMVADAEEQLRNNTRLCAQFERKFKLEDDPRVTRLGAFLRKTSIDEFPQLFQVLCGKMTLIGPRPIVRKEVEKYGVYQHKLLSVRPGLSGLWQTCGRTDTSYLDRMRLDLFYIDHRCFSLDLTLLFLTVIAVLRRSGAR